MSSKKELFLVGWSKSGTGRGDKVKAFAATLKRRMFGTWAERGSARKGRGSFSGGGDLQVLVVDYGVGGGGGGDVVGGVEGFEVGGEGALAGFVEAGEGRLGGAEICAEPGDDFGWGHGQVKVYGDELGADVGEAGGQALADGCVVAPKDGRGDAGRGRDVIGVELEHLAGEAGGVPVGHGEEAAGLQDAGELGGDEVGAGGEHGAEHGGDGVEGGVGVRELLGVALVEGDGEVFVGGALAGLDEEVGGDVYAGDDASVAGEGDGGVAGAAGYVEDTGAGGEVEAVDEVDGTAGDGSGDDAEVTGHPGGAHGGFDLGDGGWSGGFSRVHGAGSGGDKDACYWKTGREGVGPDPLIAVRWR